MYSDSFVLREGSRPKIFFRLSFLQEYPVGDWPADEESSGGEKDYPDTPGTPPTSEHSSYNVFEFDAEMDLRRRAVFAARDGEEVTLQAHTYY